MHTGAASLAEPKSVASDQPSTPRLQRVINSARSLIISIGLTCASLKPTYRLLARLAVGLRGGLLHVTSQCCGTGGSGGEHQRSRARHTASTRPSHFPSHGDRCPRVARHRTSDVVSRPGEALVHRHVPRLRATVPA